MHASENNALFTAWSEAERQAREAERQLYGAILAQEGEPARHDDVERVRNLREHASELLVQMLAGLRGEAFTLQAARRDPGATNDAP